MRAFFSPRRPLTNKEAGNALIYILIAIALFAALSFTLSRNTQTGQADDISDAQVTFYATELMSYVGQVQSVIDQMLYTGSTIDDLDYTMPDEDGFNTAPYIHKMFHPQGGGLSTPYLSERFRLENDDTTEAGWYLGRFNNVEWTPTAQSDVILTAYQVSRPICATINTRITGSDAIPTLSGDIASYLIDQNGNPDFTVAACPDCEGMSMLCVGNSANALYAFYAIVGGR